SLVVLATPLLVEDEGNGRRDDTTGGADLTVDIERQLGAFLAVTEQISSLLDCSNHRSGHALLGDLLQDPGEAYFLRAALDKDNVVGTEHVCKPGPNLSQVDLKMFSVARIEGLEHTLPANSFYHGNG